MYLMSVTALYQFVKLPLLIEHYIDHKSIDNNITFRNFLFMHYVLTDDGDGDKSADMKLPFKTCDEWGTSVNLTISFLPSIFSLEKIQVPFFEVKKTIIENNFFLTSSFLSIVWQPPRTC
jgi:hypothetical protein